MVLYLSDDEVRSLLPIDEAIAVLEKLFRSEVNGQTESLPTAELLLGNGVFRLKAGAAYDINCYGFKAYGNGRYIVFVYDYETGQMVGIVEARGLTEIRTGAVSALAARYMARADASTVGIIGTGREARAQLAGLCQVRPVATVKAYSRTAKKRESFAEEMSEKYGVEVSAVATAEDCARDVDMVVTITTTEAPVLEGKWIREGTFVCAVGATTPYRRELDDETVARAATVVVESLSQAEAEIGELRHAAAHGKLRWSMVRELKDLVAGYVPGRLSDTDITLFDSVGIGAEDVAIASYVLGKARSREVGQVLPL